MKWRFLSHVSSPIDGFEAQNQKAFREEIEIARKYDDTIAANGRRKEKIYLLFAWVLNIHEINVPFPSSMRQKRR